MSQSFKQRLAALKETHGYKVEVAKLEFVRGITREMKLKGINNSHLAERIDTSSAYITKALRGESNFTIDSMVKLASAVGANLHIHIADNAASVKWFEVHPSAVCPTSKPENVLEKCLNQTGLFSPEGIREMYDESCKLYA